MIRELVKDVDVLSKRCEAATPEDAAIAQDLIDTLETIDDASCLAANQIGETKAVVVWFDDDKSPHVMYNPKILLGLNPHMSVEGCLTIDEPSKVRRFGKIKVAFDELVDGEFKQRKHDYTDWYAQMIQHMVDHCNGKLV